MVFVKSGGLSTAAKAGIGIGVPVGVLLVAAAVFFSLWGRMARSQDGGAGVEAHPEGQGTIVEEGALGDTASPHELDGRQRHELPASQKLPAELPEKK
jgi:hypothetical protein